MLISLKQKKVIPKRDAILLYIEQQFKYTVTIFHVFNTLKVNITHFLLWASEKLSLLKCAHHLDTIQVM